MGEFKGTKGEWELIYSGLDFIIKGCKIKEIKPNAQLISCAPEMLEMLIKLSYDFEDEELENLIKKATELK